MLEPSGGVPKLASVFLQPIVAIEPCNKTSSPFPGRHHDTGGHKGASTNVAVASSVVPIDRWIGSESRPIYENEVR